MNRSEDTGCRALRYSPTRFLNQMNRREIILVVLASLVFACNEDNNRFIIQTKDQYDTINGENRLVAQIIKTLRVSDSLPIVILTRVSNYHNDIRARHLTGLTEEDGIQNYLMDSVYYDGRGNDTLKQSFVYLHEEWQSTQVFHKRFREDGQVSYFMTERPYKKDHYFKQEIFYSYNNDGSISTETEVECFTKTDCDSVFREEFIYNFVGDIDSTVLYLWEDGRWVEFKANSR